MKLFNDFKQICVKNDSTIRLKSTKCADVKVKEVLLNDLNWKSESHEPKSTLLNEKRLSCVNENSSILVRENVYHQTDVGKNSPEISELTLSRKQYNTDETYSTVMCINISWIILN